MKMTMYSPQLELQVRSAGNRLPELALQRIQQGTGLLHLGLDSGCAQPKPEPEPRLQQRTMGTGMSAATRGQRRPTASLNP